MDLVFPFRNITINTLWDFFDKEKIGEFSDIRTEKESWKGEYFDGDVARWRGSLPNLENELLQVINTTDQKTIDEYFNSFIAQLNQIHSYLNRDYFRDSIAKWNSESLVEYAEIIKTKEEEYFKQEERQKRHLEEYEGWSYPLLGLPRGQFNKVTKINYNFYCVEQTPNLVSLDIVDDYFSLIDTLFKELIDAIKRYIIQWQNGQVKSKIQQQSIPKPIFFVEGEHDITLITKAAELLNKIDLLNKIELRQRGGYRNLDKLWNILNEESWETVPQTKVFLYDCDTNKSEEDFGNHYKRVIPSNQTSIVKKGIENLFPNDLITRSIQVKKAFVDFKKTVGIRRGIEYEEELNEINKDEKKNFCDWVCKNGTSDDFIGFNAIFDIIQSFI